MLGTIFLRYTVIIKRRIIKVKNYQLKKNRSPKLDK